MGSSEEAGSLRLTRLPAATLRLQLGGDLDFAAAAALTPYFTSLGVTEIYLSPVLAAAPGSIHGYDVTRHDALRDDLGGEAGLAALAETLAAAGIGIVLDFVPNHMGVDRPRANPWWWDVLENGECSPYARFFDVDWDPVKPELRGRVLLPILGDQYGRLLENGELTLGYDAGVFVLRYFERELPINPRRAPEVLGIGLEGLKTELGEEDPDLRELLSVMTALGNLPSRVETDAARVAERRREKEIARERLARLVERSHPIRGHVERALRRINGRPGEAASFDSLHALLEGQAYRLAYWRTAFHEINYRRFFDVNGLASIRMEDPEVFAAAHGLLLRLASEGRMTGLRLDHLDGLADPAGYLERLRDAFARVMAAGGAPTPSPSATGSARPSHLEVAVAAGPPGAAAAAASPGLDRARALPLWLPAEKILSPEERLPDSWAFHGTTGYDFLNDVCGLFVDPQGAGPLLRLYQRFTKREASFDEVQYASKKAVMASTLASELNLLAHDLNRISEGDRRSRDFTLNSLHETLLEVVACFPVYRTYVTPKGHREEDRRLLDLAVSRARRRNPTLGAGIFEFLLDVMLDRGGPWPPEEARARHEFARKFQQYTGPVQAKGVEDTAFYRHVALLALNEVGGDPRRIGRAPEAFHAANLERLSRWPRAMTCTSTHDTKRGEDARARIAALSELPDAWRREVQRWARLNAGNRTRVDNEWAPDRGDEYLFYQALLGAWPAEGLRPAGGVRAAGASPERAALRERLADYMRKAVREAKLHTSWINENQAYEQAVQVFVEGALTGRHAPAFLEAFEPFARRVAAIGMVNSLATVALKCASPGVPDFYQGSELWDLSLADPDNRRPVDFDTRRAMLADLGPLLSGSLPAADHAARAAELLARWEDGRIKMLVTAAALRMRRSRPQLFLEGEYVPLEARGEHADRVVAFLRRSGSQAAIAAVPRLVAHLGDGAPPLGPCWGDTRLALPEEWAGSAWRDAVSGAEHRVGADAARNHAAHLSPALPLSRLFETVPVALLEFVPATLG